MIDCEMNPNWRMPRHRWLAGRAGVRRQSRHPVRGFEPFVQSDCHNDLDPPTPPCPVHLLRPRRHTLSQTFGLLWPSKSFVHPTTDCPLEFRPNDWSLVYLGRLKTPGLASVERYSHKVFIPHLEAPLLSSNSNSSSGNPDLFSTPVFPSKSEKKFSPKCFYFTLG